VAHDLIYRYLDTVGDGSGVKDHAADYGDDDAAPVFIKPPESEVYVLSRVLISIVAAGQVAAAKFGDMSALINGIAIKMERGAVALLDLTDGLPIKTNSDWGRLCFDVSTQGTGPGDTYILARWTFLKAGKPLYLDGGRDDRLAFYLDDDFSDLTEMTFQVQGYSKAS
jgi:hypothetical protein